MIGVTTQEQEDRLKGEDLPAENMRDQAKLRAFQPAVEVAVLVYRLTAKFLREE
jgi:hypothetical protein